MKEIETPASTCKFGNVRDSPLIDRMGCGMSDPTWLERLLRERFHPGEIHLSCKDSKTVWGKAPNNANHRFRTNTVKQKVGDKVISRSRMTKRTDVQFMSKQYKGRKKVSGQRAAMEGNGPWQPGQREQNMSQFRMKSFLGKRRMMSVYDAVLAVV